MTDKRKRGPCWHSWILNRGFLWDKAECTKCNRVIRSDTIWPQSLRRHGDIEIII